MIIISNLHSGTKLSGWLRHCSGATIKDMCDFIKPILRKKPEKVILHLGTNNLRKGDAKSVAKGIIKLPQSVEQ